MDIIWWIFRCNQTCVYLNYEVRSIEEVIHFLMETLRGSFSFWWCSIVIIQHEIKEEYLLIRNLSLFVFSLEFEVLQWQWLLLILQLVHQYCYAIETVSNRWYCPFNHTLTLVAQGKFFMEAMIYNTLLVYSTHVNMNSKLRLWKSPKTCR
jgi:hypothetical protein